MGRIILVAMLASLVAVAFPASAQIPPRSGETLLVHPQARAAIDGLKSPFCPGSMLETCPSPDAALLRDSIQALAESGLGADSIIESVLAEYGEQWRAVPRASGAGLWAWLLPPAALLTGLGVVALVLGRRSRHRAALPTEPFAPEQRTRLREALAELDLAERPDL
jgi:cytochrome c-type biogenesis protein CcmH/NrfF